MSNIQEVLGSQWGKPGWWNCAWVGSDSVGIRSTILSLAWFYGKFMTIAENKIRWSLRWSRCWPWPLKVVVTSWKRAVPCRNLAGGKKRLRCSPEAEAFGSLISVAARGHKMQNFTRLPIEKSIKPRFIRWTSCWIMQNSIGFPWHSSAAAPLSLHLP